MGSARQRLAWHGNRQYLLDWWIAWHGHGQSLFSQFFSSDFGWWMVDIGGRTVALCPAIACHCQCQLTGMRSRLCERHPSFCYRGSSLSLINFLEGWRSNSTSRILRLNLTSRLKMQSCLTTSACQPSRTNTHPPSIPLSIQPALCLHAAFTLR